jgi:RNA 3'-terminal phosphate cyclase (ATP)
LEHRGWSHGPLNTGSASFEIFPLPPGQSIKAPQWPKERGEVIKIDASLIGPKGLPERLKKALEDKVDRVFPGVDIDFIVMEDSGHTARMYTLLVAHTSTGLRFGRDWLYDRKSKNKTLDFLAAEIARKVAHDLDVELKKEGTVDEYLQDQLVVFQALAEGQCSIPGSTEVVASDSQRVDRTDEPFGDGSTHTTTARWVTSQLLPHTKWIDNGRICEGVGWKASLSAYEQQVVETTKSLEQLPTNDPGQVTNEPLSQK